MSAKRCPRCNEVVEVNVDYGKEDTSAIQLLELVDGALEVVALWNATSPAQKKWQANWIKKAKEMGASFDDDFEMDNGSKIEEGNKMKGDVSRCYDPFTCGYTPLSNFTDLPKAPKGGTGESSDLTDIQVNYIVHYKWQEGAELFFNREIIKDFAIKDEDALQKLENRLCTILSNCGMEEEHLATVQVTGITQL